MKSRDKMPKHWYRVKISDKYFLCDILSNADDCPVGCVREPTKDCENCPVYFDWKHS